MIFRTEIKIDPLSVRIGYENRILALGSCFTEHISARLLDLKFKVCSNPTGILFNPYSIARAIEACAEGRPVTDGELHEAGGTVFSYDFHSDFSALDRVSALEKMNAARTTGARALSEADRLLLTFGTAWIYEYEGRVVANCHKQPSARFHRRRLEVGEIVKRFSALMEGPLRGKQIILTVSPVRHLGDGLEENCLSKSVLRLATAILAERYPSIVYFPSFEILNDDLRDYRFYAADMMHPAQQAVEYVWEKFAEAALTPQAQELIPRIESIKKMLAHRPRDPRSEAHRQLLRQCLDRIQSLKSNKAFDFGAEEDYLRRCLEINL